MVEAMKEARSMGVEMLEVAQNSIIGREDELGQELAYTDMGISSIPSYFDFGRNEDVDKQSEEVLQAARYLGADKLLVIPGFFGPEDDEGERKRQTESIVRSLNILGDKAEKYGISLVMEDFDSHLAPFSTIEGLRYFLDNCPMLSCCFDTGNFRYMGESELEAYDALKGRIGHVHLKDRAYTQNNGEEGKTAADGQILYPCPVGSGELEISRIIHLLKQDGYQGAYAIEHYGSKATLSYLRQSVEWVLGRGIG